MTIGSTGNGQPVINSSGRRSVCVDDGAASETRGFGGKGRQSDQTAHGSRLSHRRVDQVDLSYVTARQRLGQALAANVTSIPAICQRLGVVRADFNHTAARTAKPKVRVRPWSRQP